MNPDEKKLLEETAELTEENNKLLHKLYRAHVWGRVLHTLYWVLIIGASIGAFYFIQPYLESLTALFGRVQDAQSSFSEFLNL